MSEKRYAYKQSPFRKQTNQFLRNQPGSLNQIVQKSHEGSDTTNNQNTDEQFNWRYLFLNKKSKIKNYLCAWLLFLAAFTIFILIWVIGHFTIERQASYYYFHDFNISPYTDTDFWILSKRATNSTQQVYVSSKTLYPSDSLKSVDAIALYLFFSWVLWKFPLTIFTLHMTQNKNNKVMRYSTYGSYLLFLLLIDILITAFTSQGLQQWIFFCIYVALSVILIGVNSINKRQKFLHSIFNYLVPIVYFIFIYVSYCYFVPGIYSAIYKGLDSDAPLVIVHIFPFIDLISYVLIIAMTYFCNQKSRVFIKMFYFLNTGYAVGHMLLFSPEEVEFYYLIVYFIIRNLSANWILQRVQKYVLNPAPLPGWLIIYLVSLCINFIPLIGVGNLVISKSFYSQILMVTLPILRYAVPSQYYIYYSNMLPVIQDLNSSEKSNIQISAVFIIWGALTLSQKYLRRPFQYKELFFYIFGIYIFYIGLTTGIQIQYLQANNF